MRDRFLLVIASVFLFFMGAAAAREPARLTDTQLDKITGGANIAQVPLIASFLANGNAGVSQFSPSIATLVPTVTNLSICVFCATGSR